MHAAYDSEVRTTYDIANTSSDGYYLFSEPHTLSSAARLLFRCMCVQYKSSYV